MRRTNIYLSEAAQEALDARAAVEGSTRSDIVREVIDRELDLYEDDGLDAVIGELAAELAELGRHSSRADPDLRCE